MTKCPYCWATSRAVSAVLVVEPEEDEMSHWGPSAFRLRTDEAVVQPPYLLVETLSTLM